MNTIYIDAKIKRERKWLATQSASGYYRSVINIVSLAGARQGIMITPSLFSVRVRETLGLDLSPRENFCWRLDLTRLIELYTTRIAHCVIEKFWQCFFFFFF